MLSLFITTFQYNVPGKIASEQKNETRHKRREIEKFFWEKLAKYQRTSGNVAQSAQSAQFIWNEFPLILVHVCCFYRSLFDKST